jgi:hypothetical protein
MLRQTIFSAILFFTGMTFFLQAQSITPKFDPLSVAISRNILKDSKGFNCFGFTGGLTKQDGIREKHQIQTRFGSVSILCDLMSSTEENEIEVFFSDSLNINAGDWSARGGCWDFTGKVIRAQGFIGYNRAYYNHKVFTDFIYEVKLYKAAEDGTLGLLFRYDEKNDEGYLLHFWPHGGCKFELFKGGQTRLRTVEVSQPMHQIIGTGVWNIVKIVAHGARFKIYLNGYLLDTIVDSQYSSGRVGLFVAGDPRQIALFEVTTIRAP